MRWSWPPVEVLELARGLPSPWEEAIAHNDLAHFRMATGDPAAAEDHIDAGLRIAAGIQPAEFVTGVLHRRAEQLEALQDQLREQADRDPLTGLRNRRCLERARDELASDPSVPVSFAVLDLDHFKSVNDRFGHQVGHEVLVRIADERLYAAKRGGRDRVVHGRVAA